MRRRRVRLPRPPRRGAVARWPFARWPFARPSFPRRSPRGLRPRRGAPEPEPDGARADVPPSVSAAAPAGEPPPGPVTGPVTADASRDRAAPPATDRAGGLPSGAAPASAPADRPPEVPPGVSSGSPPERREPGPAAPPARRRSLRTRLTFANAVLLLLGIVAATVVSVMSMRHFILDQIDGELKQTRQSVAGSRLTLETIAGLSELALVRERLTGEYGGDRNPKQMMTLVDARGAPLSAGGFTVSPAQRELAAAVGAPGALAATDEPRDVEVRGTAYRATAARLADGTYVLLASSTEAVHASVRKAVRLDLLVGLVLLACLVSLTMLSVRRRMRPLVDMVETSSAIAEGDLTRRVPSSREAGREVEQLRLALNAMLQQVEAAYRTRERSAAQLRRFVADASHELRTPLSAIRGYLQLYDKGMLTDEGERRRVWARVLAETERMSRLVEELLTLARLDQSPQLRFRNVDVARLVREAAEDLRVQQPGRPVEVRAEGVLLARADESGLRKVLGNLVSNVRTHTPADVPVRLAVRREDGQVRITVADEGPGLGAEDAARVFDRFFRAGGGAGSGLGMAIVQGVVRTHGGRVSVRTAPGEGFAVTVLLPDGPAEAHEDTAPETGGDGEPAAG